MLGRRDVEFVVEDRIARRVFVDVGGAVADPLPRDEDRQFDVVLDLAHLERRRVAVPHQIVDQAAILADPLGAAAVGDARRLHDRGVVAHVVDDADEAVVEHRQRLVEDFLERRHGGAAGRVVAARAAAISACCSGVSGIAAPGSRASAGMPPPCPPQHAGIERAPASPRQPRSGVSKDARELRFRLADTLYLSRAGQPAMAINGLRNKRCGPGGGTRRLHQFPPPARS